MEFGVGMNIQYYNVIEIAESIGEKMALALPFFHSFTGCDTTSSFYYYGKCSFWDTWMDTNYKDVDTLIDVFIELGNMPASVTQHHINIITNYLIKVYFSKDSSATSLSLGKLRYKSFFKSPDPNLKAIIPSNQGLIEHVKRSAFQAGWLWRECQLNPDYPLITDWGWVKEETRFFPKWCFEYKSLDLVIITCSCKEDGKCNRCKCSLSKQSCLEFCHCQRHCSK